MSRKRANKTRPFVQLDAQFLKWYMPIIGSHGLAVYTSLKLHENRRTGQCNPSYQTIADETGLSRPTVIKYAQLLSRLKLIKIVPIWTAVSDRSSNQYVMVHPGSIKNPDPEPIPPPDNIDSGGKGDIPPSLNGENVIDHPSKAALPNPESSNQNIYITKEKDPEKPILIKQQTCSHPAETIHHIEHGINICNQCFGLLDDNGVLVEEVAADAGDEMK